MFDRAVFSERLINLRTKNNIMAKDVALYIGISKQAFSQYEKQQSAPSTDILVSIAEYFDVSLDYLTGRTDEQDIINHNNDLPVTQQESELLEDFRLLNKHEQNIIIGKISEMIYNKIVEENNNNLEVSEEILNAELIDRLNK